MRTLTAILCGIVLLACSETGPDKPAAPPPADKLPTTQATTAGGVQITRLPGWEAEAVVDRGLVKIRLANGPMPPDGSLPPAGQVLLSVFEVHEKEATERPSAFEDLAGPASLHGKASLANESVQARNVVIGGRYFLLSARFRPGSPPSPTVWSEMDRMLGTVKVDPSPSLCCRGYRSPSR